MSPVLYANLLPSILSLVIIVVSIEPLGTFALIITKLFTKNAITTAAINILIQLKISFFKSKGSNSSNFLFIFFFSFLVKLGSFNCS